jgi:hypothetical protein
MCYGKFIRSFAACLGKIGHTLRGDSTWTGAGNEESEAGLSIYSEFAIKPETLQRYRLPSRGTYAGVLL